MLSLIKMRQITRQIPNFITTLNIISGSLAVFFAIDGHLIWAGVFICLAAIFDYLDGTAAYLLKAYSDIGKQLDSLADVISFGLAPGAILFTLLEFSLFGENQLIYNINCPWYNWLILSSALLIPVFGAIRLAKYNVNSSHEPFFRGLPIPANGLLWASFGLMIQYTQHQELMKFLFSTRNLVILSVFMAGFMVSNLPMFSLKIKSFGFKENWYRYLFILISALLLVFLNVYGLAFIVFAYIILNALFYVLNVKY